MIPASLRSLLAQPPNQDSFRQITVESAMLLGEPGPFRWFFFVLNRTFVFLVDNGELSDPDTSEPILETLYQCVRDGIDAVDNNKMDDLIEAANHLVAAYSVLP
jgi:hypothetical protein